jgi:GcrA cell cycle regulator
MSWNYERVECLKKMWAEGFSASQIAAHLGDMTRHAVIGKVHRLGLSGRAPTSRMKAASRRPSHAPPARPKPPPAHAAVVPTIAQKALRAPLEKEAPKPPVEELEIPEAERKTLSSIEPRQCHWPYGDTAASDFYFCGKTATRGAYCAFHAGKAFQPQSNRKKKVEA